MPKSAPAAVWVWNRFCNRILGGFDGQCSKCKGDILGHAIEKTTIHIMGSTTGGHILNSGRFRVELHCQNCGMTTEVLWSYTFVPSSQEFLFLKFDNKKSVRGISALGDGTVIVSPSEWEAAYNLYRAGISKAYRQRKKIAAKQLDNSVVSQ